MKHTKGTTNSDWRRIVQNVRSLVSAKDYDLWLSKLVLVEVYEEIKLIQAAVGDPFVAAVIAKRFREDLDKAAATVLGEGYSMGVTVDESLVDYNGCLNIKTLSYDSDNTIKAILLVNNNTTAEELIQIGLGGFAFYGTDEKQYNTKNNN